MLSFQDQYTLFQDLTSDGDSTNRDQIGKVLIREGQKNLESTLGIYFTEEERTFTVVTDAISGTSNQAYKLPENFKSLTSLYVTVGTTRYYADLIQDEDHWARINATTTQSTSTFLTKCFIRNDRVLFYPIPPSTGTNTATIIYGAFTKPLSIDNYTEGTITTLANAGVAVTASGSTFTAQMAGRYFKINGDGEWYKIASFGTATTLTLDTKYQGIAISAGTEAYTIGQMPITPRDTHELPVYYAIWKWSLFRKDVQLAREYERMWKEGVRDAKANWGNRSSSMIIQGTPMGGGSRIKNPNNWPSSMS